jgi:hypothetical protein
MGSVCSAGSELSGIMMRSLLCVAALLAALTRLGLLVSGVPLVVVFIMGVLVRMVLAVVLEVLALVLLGELGVVVAVALGVGVLLSRVLGVRVTVEVARRARLTNRRDRWRGVYVCSLCVCECVSV